MIPQFTFLVGLLALFLLLRRNALASPLPYQSISESGTNPITGRYHHHTDTDPHIDAVYDRVRLRKPYPKRSNTGDEGSFIPASIDELPNNRFRDGR